MSKGSKVDLTKWPHEVVTTSNDAWHSGGVTGVTVYSTKGLALRALESDKARLKAGEGVFVRPAPEWEVSHKWVGTDFPMLQVTVRGPAAALRRFTAKAAARARKVAREDGPGVRAVRISSGGSSAVMPHGVRMEYRATYSVRAGE